MDLKNLKNLMYVEKIRTQNKKKLSKRSKIVNHVLKKQIFIKHQKIIDI